ncbi:MAG: amidohydrolase [Sphingomonadaceae bacterium]|nr:amidohydrolase [Sphingomonadaceae bacterium]
MSEADPAIVSGKVENWHLGPIFDIDAHIDPPKDMWAEYLPAHLKDRAPQIVSEADGDYVVFEGNKRPFLMINNQAGRKGKDFKMVGRVSDVRPIWDPQIRLQDMDADGMDYALMFGGGPLGTMDNELYLASYDAYNRWVMDFSKNAPDRLFPVGYVTMRDVDETVEQVKNLARMGFKAINMPAFPQNPDAWKTDSGVKALKDGQVSALTGDRGGALQYMDPEFDKLWATVVDTDMALTFHLGARVPRFGQKEYFLADMPMSKLAMAEPIGIFIFNCIFDRFPDLRMCSVESGVGWMAWLAEYMDRTWEKQRYWTESKLKNPPSYYMDKNVWGSFINDRSGILMRNEPGGKNIMWSSDYPHSETTFPNSHQVILRDCEGVPEGDIRDIICNNAKKFLKVE